MHAVSIKSTFNRRAFEDAADDLKVTFRDLAELLDRRSDAATPVIDAKLRRSFSRMLEVRARFHEWSDGHAQRISWAEQMAQAKELDELVVERLGWTPRRCRGEPQTTAEARLRGLRQQAIRRATRFYANVLGENGVPAIEPAIPVSEKVLNRQHKWRRDRLTAAYLKGLAHDAKVRRLKEPESPKPEVLEIIDRVARDEAADHADAVARLGRWDLERWMSEYRRDRAAAARRRRESQPLRELTDDKELDRYRRNEKGADRQADRLGQQLARLRQLERRASKGYSSGFQYLPPIPSGFERDAHGYVATSSEPEAIRLRVTLLKQKYGDVTASEKMTPGQLLMLEIAAHKAMLDYHQQLHDLCAEPHLWAAFLAFELHVVVRLTPPRRPTAAAVLDAVRSRLAPHQYPASMRPQLLVERFGSRFGGLTPNARGGGARKKRSVDAAMSGLARDFEKEVEAQIDVERSYKVVLDAGAGGASEQQVHKTLGGRKARATAALLVLKDRGRVDHVGGRWVATLAAPVPKEPECAPTRG